MKWLFVAFFTLVKIGESSDVFTKWVDQTPQRFALDSILPSFNCSSDEVSCWRVATSLHFRPYEGRVSPQDGRAAALFLYHQLIKSAANDASRSPALNNAALILAAQGQIQLATDMLTRSAQHTWMSSTTCVQSLAQKEAVDDLQLAAHPLSFFNLVLLSADPYLRTELRPVDGFTTNSPNSCISTDAHPLTDLANRVDSLFRLEPNKELCTKNALLTDVHLPSWSHSSSDAWVKCKRTLAAIKSAVLDAILFAAQRLDDLSLARNCSNDPRKLTAMSSRRIRTIVRRIHLMQSTAQWRDLELLQSSLSNILEISLQHYHHHHYDDDQQQQQQQQQHLTADLCGEFLPGLLGPSSHILAHAGDEACAMKSSELLRISRHAVRQHPVRRTTANDSTQDGLGLHDFRMTTIALFLPTFSLTHPAGQQSRLLLESLADIGVPRLLCMTLESRKDRTERLKAQRTDENDEFPDYICPGHVRHLEKLSSSPSLSNAEALGEMKSVFAGSAETVLLDVSGFTLSAEAYLWYAAEKEINNVTILHFSDRINPFSRGVGLGSRGIVDYVIGDPRTSPPDGWVGRLGHRQAERWALLPTEFMIGDPVDLQSPSPSSTTLQQSVQQENPLIFSHVGRLEKVDPGTFRVWMSVMRAIPSSDFWILDGQEEEGQRDLSPGMSWGTSVNSTFLGGKYSNLIRSFNAQFSLLSEAAAAGVKPSRIRFLPRVPHGQHLARLGRSSHVAWDSRYFNGLTTTSDIIRAGVHLVTLTGADESSSFSYHARAAAAMQGPRMGGWCLSASCKGFYEDRSYRITAASSTKQLETESVRVGGLEYTLSHQRHWSALKFNDSIQAASANRLKFGRTMQLMSQVVLELKNMGKSHHAIVL